jgi:hypothetical protein
MGWKKRASEHLLSARNALDDADEVASSDVASRNRVDVFMKHVSKGFLESALSLVEAYASQDAEGKKSMRAWVGADLIDAAVALSIARGSKKEAA